MVTGTRERGHASASRSCGRHDAGASIRGRGSRSNPHRRGNGDLPYCRGRCRFLGDVAAIDYRVAVWRDRGPVGSRCCTARSCCRSLLSPPRTAELSTTGFRNSISIDVQVSMDDHWRRQGLGGQRLAFFCTDDVAVAGAMQLAAQSAAARGGEGKHYLNLSLGTYVPAASPGGFNPALQSICAWTPPSALLMITTSL